MFVSEGVRSREDGTTVPKVAVLLRARGWHSLRIWGTVSLLLQNEQIGVVSLVRRCWCVDRMCPSRRRTKVVIWCRVVEKGYKTLLH